MDWQQGMVVFYTDGNDVQPVLVYIKDGKALFEGQVFESRK